MDGLDILEVTIDEYQYTPPHGQAYDKKTGMGVKFGRFDLLEFTDGERLDGVFARNDMFLRLKSASKKGDPVTIYVEHNDGPSGAIIAIRDDDKLYVDNASKVSVNALGFGYFFMSILLCLVIIGFSLLAYGVVTRPREKRRLKFFNEVVRIGNEQGLKIIEI